MSSAGMSVSAFGAGPLLLTGVLVVLSYRAGRARELSAPAGGSMGTRTGRAALVAVPYGAICLAIFILATVVPGGDSADVVVSPSIIALLTPWLLVGAAAALGGMTARPRFPDGAVIRSAVAGVYGVLVGLVLLAVLGLVVFTVKLALAPQSLGAASAPAVLGGIVLACAYAVNAVGLGLGDALGLTLFGQGAYVLLMVAPVVGAAAGGLVVHKRARPLDRSPYIAAFAVTSTLLCFVATPIATGSAFGVGTMVSSGGSPLVVLLTSSLLASVASWGAGYVRLANAPLWVPFAIAAVRVLGHAEARAFQPTRQGAVAGATGDPLPVEPSPSPPAHLHVPRRIWLPVVGVLVLGGGLATTNAVLSSRYSPEATVEAFLAAQAGHDNARLVSVTLFHAGGNGIMLTDRAALDRMDRPPQNRRSDISDLRVLSVTRNGPRATAEVSYMIGGIPTHLTLTLVQNSSTKHLGLYPAWQVQVEAPALTIIAPALHGPVRRWLPHRSRQLEGLRGLRGARVPRGAHGTGPCHARRSPGGRDGWVRGGSREPPDPAEPGGRGCRTAGAS